MLVTRHTPVLLRYFRRVVSDTQTAEDLTQETLLDAWKGLPEFSFRSSFRTWMFAIAHRKSVDHFRRRRDIPTDDDQFRDLVSAQPLPAEAALNTTLFDALRAELQNLPYFSRAAWWLREVEGLSHEEISRVLHISSGSVRGHLQRSRQYLSTRLQPWRPGADHDTMATGAPTDAVRGRLPGTTRSQGGSR